MYDSRVDTFQHIARVQELILLAVAELLKRVAAHDASKLVSPEVEVFDRVTPMLATLEYGTEAYRASLADMGPALDHHYEHNRHHPEHWEVRRIAWEAVPGYEGFYEVSNFGDVRSVARTVERPGRGDTVAKAAQEIVAHLTPKGYLRVSLVRDGQARNFLVHRLVAQVFISNPDGKPEVNHKNGVKHDNHVWNLEWATPSENQVHAYDTGLREPAVKFVVHCPELDLTTFGTQRMEEELRSRGYERARASGIWSAMDRGGKHLDLTFEGTSLAEYRRARLESMNLVDLIEMVCDWKAASERMKAPRASLEDGEMRVREPSPIVKSIRTINRERFGYDDDLEAVLVNTVEEVLEGGAGCQ